MAIKLLDLRQMSSAMSTKLKGDAKTYGLRGVGVMTLFAGALALGAAARGATGACTAGICQSFVSHHCLWEECLCLKAAECLHGWRQQRSSDNGRKKDGKRDRRTHDDWSFDV